MTTPESNKIFISWSGEPSKTIAKFLKIWLEDVVDNISVWVSDVDIAAGSRSMQEIENTLRDSRMGIIVTTKANMGKDWINFEAGALSKEVGPATGRVVPLLVDFAAMTELVGPLNVFQAVMLTKGDIEKLLRTVYEVIHGDDKSATKIERYWPDIESQIDGWRSTAEIVARPDAKPPRRTDDMVAEVLSIVRELRDSREPTTAGGPGHSGSLGRGASPTVDRVRNAIDSLTSDLADHVVSIKSGSTGPDGLVFVVVDGRTTELQRDQIQAELTTRVPEVVVTLQGAPRRSGDTNP